MTVSETNESPLLAEQRRNFLRFLNSLPLKGYGQLEGLIDNKNRLTILVVHANHQAVLAIQRVDTLHPAGAQLSYETPGVPAFDGQTAEETAKWVFGELQEMLRLQKGFRRLENLLLTYRKTVLKGGVVTLVDQIYDFRFSTFQAIQKNTAWADLMECLKGEGVVVEVLPGQVDEGDFIFKLTKRDAFEEVKAAIAALHPLEDEFFPPEGKSFNLSALLGESEGAQLALILASPGWRKIRQELEHYGFHIIIQGPMGQKVLTLKPKRTSKPRAA